MLGPERPVFGVVGTTLRQGRLPRPSGGHAQLTRQLSALTRRWPYPTHWVTGAPATRRHSVVRAPNQAAGQLLHCGQATPGNRRMRLAHAPLHHSTGARRSTSPARLTFLPAGTNGPFQGLTNFIE
jgi:hypothetical protein